MLLIDTHVLVDAALVTADRKMLAWPRIETVDAER
jgi:hypothetical protein